MRRITLFAGHYGSGKTNVAVNYARCLRRRLPASRPVAIADLDIVNPYFRTKDSERALAAEGIGLVVSEFANSNVDFPAMPKEAYSLMVPPARGAEDLAPYVVVDVGGDDRGALALGRYVPDIVAGNDYEMLGVVNFSRPLTRDVASAVEVLREIEDACGLKFTGVVNNTNLGPDTTVSTVIDSEPLALAVAEAMGIELALTTVVVPLAAELRGRIRGKLMPLELQRLYYHLTDTRA